MRGMLTELSLTLAAPGILFWADAERKEKKERMRRHTARRKWSESRHCATSIKVPSQMPVSLCFHS